MGEKVDKHCFELMFKCTRFLGICLSVCLRVAVVCLVVYSWTCRLQNEDGFGALFLNNTAYSRCDDRL